MGSSRFIHVDKMGRLAAARRVYPVTSALTLTLTLTLILALTLTLAVAQTLIRRECPAHDVACTFDRLPTQRPGFFALRSRLTGHFVRLIDESRPDEEAL